MGRDAYELGLVDELGGLSQALEEAVHLANLGGDYKIEEFPKIETPADALAELLDIRSAPPKPFPSKIQNPLVNRLTEAQAFRNLLTDPFGLYGILPWYRSQLGFKPWGINL